MITERKRIKKIVGTILGVILVVVMVWTLFPLYWVLLMSFKEPIDIIHYPPKFIFDPTLDNYRTLLLGYVSAHAHVRAEFPRYFLNSLIICFGAIVLSMIVGLPAAYSLARYKFRGKEDFAFTLLSFRFAPELIIIIPLFLVYVEVGLQDTHLGLILAYQLITLPFTVWLMRGFFESIPPELEHAARIDGYPMWKILYKVNLPLVAPGIGATTILALIFAYHNFLLGSVLSGPATRPATPALLGFIGYGEVLWGQMAGATILVLLPSLCLAFLVQRFIVRGLTFGAVKG